jgi:hypothetical protein
MKRKAFITAFLVASIGLVAFTVNKNNGGDLTKVSVVHHEGNEVTVLDTVFDPATGYTVEQFLLDNGLDPSTTEIINTDNLEGAHVHHLSEDIWFMDGQSETNGDFRVRTMVVGADGEHSGDAKIVKRRIGNHSEGGEMKEVKIIKEVDDDGNVTMKKIVNGEEVEMGEDDLHWVDESGEHHKVSGDNVFINCEGGENGNVFIHKISEDIGEDGENKIIRKIHLADGEELSDEEMNEMIDKILEENGIDQDSENGQPVIIKKIVTDKQMQNGEGSSETIIELLEGGEGAVEGEEMEVEIEAIIDENGEEQLLIWVNGEEVDPDEYENLFIHEGGDMEMEMEIEIIELSDGENEDIIIINGGDCEDKAIFEHMSSDQSYTIAIVSNVSQSNPSEEPEAEERSEAQIETPAMEINELTFAPNPSTGQFTLSFNLPEKGRTAILIHDMTGQVVYEEKLGKFSGEYRNDIDISNHGSGTYILSILHGKDKIAEKLIVQ